MPNLKSKIIALVMMLGCSAAYAQEQEKIMMTQAPCAEWPVMVEMVEKHGEKPLFIGEGLTFQAGTGQPWEGGMVFTVNQEPDAGNWTMFQVFQDGMACMIMNGGEFQPWMGN